MWQKLNALDGMSLEKARVQLLNIVQLVCAVPRSFSSKDGAMKENNLKWNSETTSLYCHLENSASQILISLDVKDLVLSIAGSDNHVEHLVLSGITYPMAYGWLRIKLDTFGLDGEQFTDATPYTLERYLDGDEEMTVFDERLFENIAIYYSNAVIILNEIRVTKPLPGAILVDPSNLYIMLQPQMSESGFIPGFSIGSRFYPEPNYFVQMVNQDQKTIDAIEAKDHLWKNKDWQGLLLPAGDFLSHDQDIEWKKIMTFFGNGLQH